MQNFISVNNAGKELELSYTDNEKKNCPVLLFVHGNSSSSETFKELTDFLKSNFRTIAIDLPGHGKSKKLPAEEYSIENLSKVLLSFIKEINIDIFALFGHSLGGHICLQSLAEINPKKLILWGTPPLANPPVMESMFLPSPAAGLLFQEELSEEELMILYKESFYTPSSDGYVKFANTHGQADPQFRTNILKNLMNLQYKDEVCELDNFEGQVLFLSGSNEKFINRKYIEENLLKGQLVVIEESGHYPHNENLSEFAMTAMSFFNTGNNTNTAERLQRLDGR